MSVVHSSSPLIAVGGIDGAGKSSAVAAVVEVLGPAVASVATSVKVAAERVRRLSGIGSDSVLDVWSPVADSLKFAHAFDFLEHYERELIPRFRRNQLVLSDRWSYCTVAYGDIGRRLGRQVEAVLQPVRAPDAYIYLEIDPELAHSRILSRGVPKLDESLAILREYSLAYERLLPTLPCRVVRLRNDERHSTVNGVLDVCREYLSRR